MRALSLLPVKPIATFVHAVVAVAVTAGVPLLAGRRTRLSVGAGTAAYVVLVAAL
ncbi:MAG: hypothetical protein QM695_00790 [Micropruina sp.]